MRSEALRLSCYPVGLRVRRRIGEEVWNMMNARLVRFNPLGISSVVVNGTLAWDDHVREAARGLD